MKYKVTYTAAAKKDLRNIFRYISEKLLSTQNAVGQTERIMTAIRSLDTMPKRNRLYEKEPWHGRGLRFFPVDIYRNLATEIMAPHFMMSLIVSIVSIVS